MGRFWHIGVTKRLFGSRTKCIMAPTFEGNAIAAGGT